MRHNIYISPDLEPDYQKIPQGKRSPLINRLLKEHFAKEREDLFNPLEEVRGR